MSTYRARRGEAFSLAEREALIDRYRAAWAAMEAIELGPGNEDGTPEGRARLEELRAKRSAVAAEYVDGVPILGLSRSPFDGAVFETSLDPHGIDGLWWAYDHEYRPHVEPPRTFYAWTGALKLDGPIPAWSLKAMVGPEVPFVIPRILEHPNIRAVVGSLPIGEHVGFPIVYFADPIPEGLERVDDWGHRSYTVIRPDGSPVADHSVQDDAEKDFDLRPWLGNGKLLWIAPGDDGLELREGADGCPYINLPGERRRRYIQEGRTRLA